MIRRFATAATVVALVAAAGQADWTGSYADLTGRAEYEASTNIALASDTLYTGLGGASPGYNGGIGYQLSDFQLNLLYQEIKDKTKAETRGDIEAFDDWRYASLGEHNFPDGETYFLRVDTDGGLPIGNWGDLDGTQEYQSDSGESWVQWTISGWWDNSTHTQAEYHTILAGDMVGDDYLRVVGDYRSFGNEVNVVEVFEGERLLCEIGGYTLDVGNLNLDVTLVPEPATLALLGSAGLLGLLRRRRRK